MDTSYLSVIASQAVSYVPIWGVWLYGLVLVSEHGAKNPDAARLITSGLIVSIVISVIGLSVAVAPMMLRERGYSVAEMGWMLGAFGLARTITAAIGWGLVLSGALKALRGERR